MNSRLLELATRHGALKARIDEQRRTLVQQSVPLENALARGDVALEGVDWLKHHPVAVALAVSAIVIARPRRAWRWAKRGFFVWRGWQAIRQSLSGVR
ncbi:YqjK-like family protein [Dechloromonas sp. A34]|uniref:YqjK-like family protein n=1 Tax=Dechloromonas sp. A34 TaxID=447588 RepID=UPI002248B692|nr:YqjK-like family protein [Dechloromonas sp. A34]